MFALCVKFSIGSTQGRQIMFGMILEMFLADRARWVAHAVVEELNDKETYCISGCYSSGLITSASRTSIGSPTAGDPDTHSSFKDSESHKLNQHSVREASSRSQMLQLEFRQ